MLTTDSPLIEDLDAALRYCKDVLDEMKKIKNFNSSLEPISFINMGMRHYQRTLVDVITKALKTIAGDLDNKVPESFEELLRQLMLPTNQRPVFLTSQTQQYLLFINNLSMIASLPIFPSNHVEDFESQRKSSMAMGRAATYMVKELENMRAWCLANVEIDE